MLTYKERRRHKPRPPPYRVNAAPTETISDDDTLTLKASGLAAGQSASTYTAGFIPATHSYQETPTSQSCVSVSVCV